MFRSDTPENINSVRIDDVAGLLSEEDAAKTEFIPSARVRLNYTKMLYDVLGYSMSSDVTLASISEPHAELVLSTAGGGKTTWSQIKAIEEKLIRKSKDGSGKKINGDKILCLVYNVHNVRQMSERHAQMVTRLMSAGIEGLNIDSNINACTMHSFCEFCRKSFVAKIGLLGFTLADRDSDLEQLMQRAYKLNCKVDGTEPNPEVPIKRLHDLSVLTKETMKSVAELQETDCFEDVGLEVEEIESVFERYESIKAKSRKYEFIDILDKVYTLLVSDKSALEQVQRYYDYVIADEVQDFTPIMWEILRLFVNDGTPLTCIGDEDQNIYSFRGANIENVLNFKKRFPDGRVYTLSENRRCGEVILDEAKRVISANVLRFDKEITGKKPGGHITLIPYNTEEGQIVKVVREIKKLTAEERNSTVICYRNSESSMLLSEMLAEADISINCIKASAPYSHEIYNHMFEILNALEMPRDRNYYKSLYKVLPCKKSEWFAAIGFKPDIYKFTTTDSKTHFASINYGNLMNYKGFADAIKILHDISDMLQTKPMNLYFDQLWHMFCSYFWNFKRSVNSNDVLDDIFEKRAYNLFNSDKKFAGVFRETQTIRSICLSDTKTGNGVALATFHSLKGLEFDRVIAIDLDDTIFPNYSLIEYKKYSEKTTQELKEAETRLWYVAVTRARENLFVYYNEDNPSKYVLDYLEWQSDGKYIAPEKSQTFVLGGEDFVDGTVDPSDDFLEDDFLEDEPKELTDDFLEDELPEETASAESVGEGSILQFPVSKEEPDLASVDLSEGNITSKSAFLNRLVSTL